MNIKIRHIFVSLSLLGLCICSTSCVDDLVSPSDSVVSINEISYNDDGTLNANICIEVPKMATVNSRAMGDNPPFEDLGLYMLVFQEGEGLTQFARLSEKETVDDDIHPNTRMVKFRVLLEPTEKNAVIHLIATDQQNLSEQIGSGMEESMVGTLYTDEGHQAYWQRIDLGNNIPSREQADKGFDKRQGSENAYKEEEANKANAILEKLVHVPMVRNFCKVSVGFGEKFSQNQTDYDDYSITGLYVINTIDRGTVAPYRASFTDQDGFVDFFDPSQTENPVPYDYRIMTDDPKSNNTNRQIDSRSQNYHGNLASGVKVINNDVANPDNITSKSVKENPDPIYFYERPARENSTDRTYAIVKITKTTESGSSTDHYYKIDLGHTYAPYTKYPVLGLFEYYHLLRNFHFKIQIHKVDGDGYPTLAGAAAGPVFNNISASVEAKSMKAISDGEDWIYVSHTSYVFTRNNQKLDLLAQFRTDIDEGNGGTIRNDLIFDNQPLLTDEDNFIDPEFIAKWNNGDPYVTYTLTCVGEPNGDLRKQEFYIYRGLISNNPIEFGLYRVITLYMHEPWTFRNIDTFPGLWEDPNELPDFSWSDKHREVGANAGDPLTLFFELPPDLPMAIFPLDFVIEADRQNIQNAYEGNAVVRSVKSTESLFAKDPTIGNKAPTTSRIQYVKTVTWEEYNGDWGEEYTDRGNKMVRCRFRTITDLNQTGVGTGGEDNSGEESHTYLRVYNPYFGVRKTDSNVNPTEDWLDYQQDGFYRNKNTSDPTPRLWDFCSSAWDKLLSDSEMNKTPRSRYTGAANSTVETLSLSEGAQNSMKYGIDKIDKDSYRYVQTSNANDAFCFSHQYPVEEEREMMIEVMVTDVNGNTQNITPPRITGTTVTTGRFTQVGDTETVEGTPYLKFRYVFTVPSTTNGVTVSVQPPTNAPNMRFYKIDFYPRWDDLKPESQPETP